MDLTNLAIFREVKRTLPLGQSRTFDALLIDSLGTMTPRAVWEKAIRLTSENMRRQADREIVDREEMERRRQQQEHGA